MNGFQIQLNKTIARMEKDELKALRYYLVKYPDIPAWYVNGENIAPRQIARWARDGKYPATPSELESCRAQADALLNKIYQEEDEQAERELKIGRCMDCGHLLDECICD